MLLCLFPLPFRVNLEVAVGAQKIALAQLLHHLVPSYRVLAEPKLFGPRVAVVEDQSVVTPVVAAQLALTTKVLDSFCLDLPSP